MANPAEAKECQVRVRLHPDVMKKVENRAKDLGFIKPSGEANVAAYARNLILRDLETSAIILDGQSAEYKVK